jgi:hypothetical protein
MTEKERLTITIQDLDNIENVVGSIELLFSKLISYYADKDLKTLHILALSMGAYFGDLLRTLGYSGENFKEIE